jgi:hypothetical protein
VAQGVHPAVKEVETPDAAAVRDGVMVQTGREQLRERDDPMLPTGHSGERNVGCAEFMGIIAMNSAHPVHIGASGRQTGAPRAFRHTLNAQFVTNRHYSGRVSTSNAARWRSYAASPSPSTAAILTTGGCPMAGTARSRSASW